MAVPDLAVRRIWNAARKLAAGLPLGGEAVWPGLRNDLFVAHESIYRFAGRFANGRRALDAACGTGYGALLLARSGARSVLGVDRDPRRIRFARRRFRAPGLSFEVSDCEALDFPEDTFDLVVSSNTLEHLADPARFLRTIAGSLAREGELIVAVPPVLSEADLVEHGTNPRHVSNLPVREWGALFGREGWESTYFSHRCRRALDFRSYRVSSAAVEEFAFIEEDLERAYEVAPISAVYRLRRAL